MDRLTLASVLNEYNVDYSKALAFFLRNDLGMINSPDVILSEEQYCVFCRRFKSKKKIDKLSRKDNIKSINTNKAKEIECKLTNDKDALIQAFGAGREKEVLSLCTSFNMCLGVLTGLY